jgi:ABC-2 type transport system ATP-binding protein
MSDGPAVEARGLVRRFGEDAALHEVSFDVAPGELYGIIGPDGAGKTTLFRILVTLLLPDAGSARVLGRDVVKDLWNLRTRIGYMPGRFSLYPDLSVAENLGFFASLFDTTVAEAREKIAPIWV